MEFEDVLAQTIALLQRQGRISYGALKRRFQLDDAYLEDLKVELIPTATLECVAQNCPRRITILRSPAMRETAFDGLINPCVRSRGSGSVAVGICSPHGEVSP